MKVVGITITGADDAVDVADLVHLSLEFPFVEWGILFSTTRFGQPRYPRHDWIMAFLETPRHQVRRAAHLCGDVSRKTMAGDSSWLEAFDGLFRRVQLNGWSANPGAFWLDVVPWRPFEFILQAVNESALLAAPGAAYPRPDNLSVLYDPSGGRGQPWRNPPPFPPRGMRTGYAGGIRPDNVVSVLRALHAMTDENDAWIDMESGVRTDDRFDLAKVRAVLEAAAPLIDRE